MASLRMIKREQRRIYLVKKYSKKRARLQKIIKSLETNQFEKEKAQALIQKMPRDSSKCRLSNRCKITGRSRGVYNSIGLCRNMFYFYAMNGDIPGIRKASW